MLRESRKDDSNVSDENDDRSRRSFTMSAQGAEVVVVTGASGGAGRAIARRFGEHGAAVGLIARGRAGLAGAHREVDERGGRALELPLDVADADAVERAAAEVEERFGPIDIWVNCAMTSVFGEISEVSPAEYRRATEVTYL